MCYGVCANSEQGGNKLPWQNSVKFRRQRWGLTYRLGSATLSLLAFLWDSGSNFSWWEKKQIVPSSTTNHPRKKKSIKLLKVYKPPPPPTLKVRKYKKAYQMLNMDSVCDPQQNNTAVCLLPSRYVLYFEFILSESTKQTRDFLATWRTGKFSFPPPPPSLVCVCVCVCVFVCNNFHQSTSSS